MTMLAERPLPAWSPEPEAPPVRSFAPSLRWSSLVPLGLALAAAGGAITIGSSYGRATTSAADRSHYAIFWLGVLMFMVPAAAYLCAAATPRLARVGTTIGISLFLYVPKILRDPTAPLYHDELAHWRQVQDIGAAGHLFVPNSIIPIIRDYPGLHLVTLTLQWATGLSTWGAAIALLLVAHSLSLIAVFLLVEGHTGRSRPAAIAALIYALNSSYVYFHTQFAYESLGIGLFFVVLLAMQRMEKADHRTERRTWAATAVCVSAILVTTHHLSSVFLVFVLVLWAVVALRKARRDRSAASASFARLTLFVAISELVMFGAWVAFVAPATMRYLSPYLGNATKQLISLVDGSRSGSRTALFVHSTEPLWERASALASPVLLFALAMFVLYRVRKRRQQSATAITLTLLGLCYFPSIPFILSASGAEGARRSWAFSYAGLAFLVAPGVCDVLERVRRRPLVQRLARRIVAIGVLVIVLVGNVAAGLNEYYRFPGPYAFGSDTRSLTPELLSVTNWFLYELGPEQKVVSDRYSALSLAAFGRQRLGAPGTGFPAYDLWFKNRMPSDELLGELSSSHYQYLVIDKRTAHLAPIVGVYFSPDEPDDAGGVTRLPISQASLDKFERYPWTEKIFESNNYIVYRFQFKSLGAVLAPTRP
jgi:hypothetical protein